MLELSLDLIGEAPASQNRSLSIKSLQIFLMPAREFSGIFR